MSGNQGACKQRKRSKSINLESNRKAQKKHRWQPPRQTESLVLDIQTDLSSLCSRIANILKMEDSPIWTPSSILWSSSLILAPSKRTLWRLVMLGGYCWGILSHHSYLFKLPYREKTSKGLKTLKDTIARLERSVENINQQKHELEEEVKDLKEEFEGTQSFTCSLLPHCEKVRMNYNDYGCKATELCIPVRTRSSSWQEISACNFAATHA